MLEHDAARNMVATDVTANAGARPLDAVRTRTPRIAAVAALATLYAGAALAQSPPPPPDAPPAPAHGSAQDKGPYDRGPRDGRGKEYGGPRMGHLLPGMETHLLMRMADELALSPEQRQTIRGFFASAQPGFRQLQEQMRANAELMTNTRPDDPRYQSVVQRVSQSSAELASQTVLQSSQLRTQVWSVLTAEQRTKLVAKQAEMRARWEQRRAARQAERGARRPDAARAPASPPPPPRP